MIRFDYKIKDNKVRITASINPKNYRTDTTIKVEAEDVLGYCRENAIPIGQLSHCVGPEVCSNMDTDSSTKTWVFQIDAGYKKSLLSKTKSGNIKKEEKAVKRRPLAKKQASSTRARASRIVASKKERVKNAESKEQPTE